MSSSWLVALTYQRPPGWAVTNSLGPHQHDEKLRHEKTKMYNILSHNSRRTRAGKGGRLAGDRPDPRDKEWPWWGMGADPEGGRTQTRGELGPGSGTPPSVLPTVVRGEPPFIGLHAGHRQPSQSQPATRPAALLDLSSPPLPGPGLSPSLCPGPSWGHRPAPGCTVWLPHPDADLTFQRQGLEPWAGVDSG